MLKDFLQQTTADVSQVHGLQWQYYLRWSVQIIDLASAA